MLIAELKDIGSAPASGQMLAYTRKKVIFEPYFSHDEVREKLSGEELLEIHLFDNNKEYRAISTESRRYEDGYIHHIADFPYVESQNKKSNISGDVYKEECFLESGKGRLSVLSHLGSDKNGMIVVDDYRLVMGGEQDGK